MDGMDETNNAIFFKDYNMNYENKETLMFDSTGKWEMLRFSINYN